MNVKIVIENKQMNIMKKNWEKVREYQTGYLDLNHKTQSEEYNNVELAAQLL